MLNSARVGLYKFTACQIKKIRASVISPHREWSPYKNLCDFCTACADYASHNINDTVLSLEDELVEQVVNIIKTKNISEKNIKI